MILLIDNYDSFAHNLARYFTRLGQDVCVRRNDAVSLAQIRRWRPRAIVLSPGPRTPREAGCALDVVRACWRDYPLLGVCLGHQAIVAGLGGTIARAPYPMHGRVSAILHAQRGVFRQVPSPFSACRYHSLVAVPETLPPDLDVSATTPDGLVMAVEHRRVPVVGVQFHPESILTEHGYRLLANFLELAGLPLPGQLPNRDNEICLATPIVPPLPAMPVTF